MKNLIAALSLLALACASSSRISVQPGFWKMKDRTIAVAVARHPVPQAYRIGNQGLLDVAINQAMATPLERHLASLSPERLKDAVDMFANQLEQRGFRATRVAEPIVLDSLPRLKTASGDITRNPDFRPLRTTLGTDLLLLVSIDQWGTIRQYYGFVPLGAPKAMTLAHGRLIELSSNTHAWNQTMDWDDHSYAIQGDWDISPDYPHLTDALQRSVRSAVTFLVNDFFANDPAGHLNVE